MEIVAILIISCLSIVIVFLTIKLQNKYNECRYLHSNFFRGKYELIPIISTRDPGVEDKNCNNLQSWINLETDSIWILIDNENGIWEELGHKLTKLLLNKK